MRTAKGGSYGSGAQEDGQEPGQKIHLQVVVMAGTKAALLQGSCTSHACQLHRMVASHLRANEGDGALVLLFSAPLLLPCSAAAAQTRCM